MELRHLLESEAIVFPDLMKSIISFSAAHKCELTGLSVDLTNN